MYGYITQLLIESMRNYDERLDSGRNLYIIYEVFTVYYRYHQLTSKAVANWLSEAYKVQKHKILPVNILVAPTFQPS